MTENKSGMNMAHPVLKAYARRNGLQPADFRRDGRLVLRVDGQYRVHVQPAADGRLAFTFALIDLSSLPAMRVDALLTHVAQCAALGMREHPAGLGLDAAGDRLVLQQILPPSIEIGEFEKELAEFINVLAFWQPAVMHEAALPGVV